MSLRALSIAAAGGDALLRRLDAISANLANADVAGARRTRMTADQVLETIFEPGTLAETHRDLDVAIDGDGFFRVLRADGGEVFTAARRDRHGRPLSLLRRRLQPADLHQGWPAHRYRGRPAQPDQ